MTPWSPSFFLTNSGSAAANTISQYSLAVFLYVYIRWKGLHEPTWDGECLICQHQNPWFSREFTVYILRLKDLRNNKITLKP